MSHYSAAWQADVAGRRFHMEKLTDAGGMLLIDLVDDAGGGMSVRFDSPICYRRLDEGDAMVTLKAIDASAGNGKSLYQAEASEFLTWFHNESHGIWRNRGLRHFVVTTSDDVIDVLALEPPVLQAI